MQIHVVRRRAPFIGRKGRELARLVIFVGDRHGLFPDVAGHLRIKELLDRLLLEYGGGEEEVDFLDVVPVTDPQFLGNGQLAQFGARVIRQPDRPNIFRVIGHRLEVERALELHRVAARVLDRLAERELVRLFRPRDRGTEHVGVERPAGVDVGLAEIGVSIRVALGEAWRRGKHADAKSEDPYRYAEATKFSQCHDVAPELSLRAQPPEVGPSPASTGCDQSGCVTHR